MSKLKNCFNNLKEMTSTQLIILLALFFITFGNATFFSNVTDVYPVNLKNFGFLLSLAWGFSGAIVILLALVCYPYTFKPIVISLLLISSFAGYFMDSYNTVIDDSMIENIVHTDFAESLDLFSLKLALYVIFLGILPSCLVYKINITFGTGWQLVFSRIKLIGLTLLSVLAVVFIYSNFYSSFFREHKPLRYYANPSYYIFSAGKYLNGLFVRDALAIKEIGLDARQPAHDKDRELVIFVLGETARADRFSLNGYDRETNPLLKKENVVSYSDFWSCGTSTATSVPCMFSSINTNEYSKDKVQATENVLDVLQHAGVNVLWLDNNSDSKGVAKRIPYQNYKDPEVNSVCDPECRDVGMLKNLQSYIDTHPQGDIFIVLHQMGNHGPAYYKRYPAEFEKFTPVCKTNQLEDCSKEELNNAYDNAILYTDYFLSEVIGLLKKNTEFFETALFYVSDHGESLGENGLYLHGLPRFIAPDTQTHVPVIIWVDDDFNGITMNSLAKKANNTYTHDNVFHSILRFMEIKSTIYNKQMIIN